MNVILHQCMSYIFCTLFKWDTIPYFTVWKKKKKTDDKENNFHLVLLCLFSVSTKYIFACIFSHTHDFLNAKTATISLIWYFLRL